MINLPKIDSTLAKKEITDFINEIVSSSHSDGIVVGLSGGIDSSVSAYLAVESVGVDNVLGVHMYSSTTPKEDKDHARLMAKLLDIEYVEISIDSIVDEILNTTTKSDSKLANGNLKARIRMSLLYYYANINNYLVIGTGNRSELLIGYFTKYGDGGCDLEPIGNILKTQLRVLSKSWGIPDDIITKPPRAGLWPGQNDEDEIGLSYETLDLLLYMIVDKNMDNDEIIKNINISSNEIDRIRLKIDNNKHKLTNPKTPFDFGKKF